MRPRRASPAGPLEHRARSALLKRALKRLYKKSIELVFGDPLASLVKRVSEKVGTPQITINRILKERALIDSAEYARVAVKID